MLQGMVIGYSKADITEMLNYIQDFIPKINNWAVCDSFCSGLKYTKKIRIRYGKLLKHIYTQKRNSKYGLQL